MTSSTQSRQIHCDCHWVECPRTLAEVNSTRRKGGHKMYMRCEGGNCKCGAQPMPMPAELEVEQACTPRAHLKNKRCEEHISIRHLLANLCFGSDWIRLYLGGILLTLQALVVEPLRKERCTASVGCEEHPRAQNGHELQGHGHSAEACECAHV